MKKLLDAKWNVKTKTVGNYYGWTAIINVSSEPTESSTIFVEDCLGMYKNNEEAIDAFKSFARCNRIKKDQYVLRFGLSKETEKKAESIFTTQGIKTKKEER